MAEDAPHDRSAPASWRAVDLFAFARTNREVSGSPTLADLSRLAAETPDGAPSPGARLTFEAQGLSARPAGASTQPGPWLRLKVRGEVDLLCQRCLAPCRQPLAIDQLYRIVRTEAEADAAPLDDDEMEVVVGTEAFDLIDLIDEEIMLSLPLVPKHDVCPSVHEALRAAPDMPDSPVGQANGASPDAQTQRPNPFAGLAGLARASGPDDET